MKRTLPLVIVATILLTLTDAILAGGSLATTSAPPFYLVPSPTKECRNVSNCVAVSGPWVVVPAKGEATFLFGCPVRRGFVVGGTDARASSSNVQVWFDGQLGAPIGFPPSAVRAGAVLLFHAVTDNARPGSFQPILGCVSLTPSNKVATVSLRRAGALPGTAPGSPLDLRAKEVVLSRLTSRPTTESCPRGEKLVGSWNALVFDTTAPPAPPYTSAATVKTVVVGNEVHAVFHVLGILLAPLAPLVSAQIGAMCEP
jgi:hypothetical protein